MPNRVLFSLWALLLSANANAQNGTTKQWRIAVLAPLYIDSVFTDTFFTGSLPLPKYMQPGLEFYQGAMAAVDSLQKEQLPVEVWVYDTRKAHQTAEELQTEMGNRHFSLIIAALGSAVEQQSFSKYAFSQNIPFISATYPNDAGVAGNPYFAIINPTLKTHVEALYTYVQHNHVGNNVYYITSKGGMEDKIKTYFDGAAAKTAKLKYTLLTMPDTFTAANLRPLIADTSAENVFICGSLNGNFGWQMVHGLSTIGFTHPATAIGMPTWDGAKLLTSDDSKNVQIVYSTPYNYSRANKMVAALAEAYKNKYSTRPSDMFFKGYEAMYHFTRLLVKLQDSLLFNLSNPAFRVCNVYHFQPVYLTPTSYAPDYQENKKLYIIKMLNGEIKSVN